MSDFLDDSISAGPQISPTDHAMRLSAGDSEGAHGDYFRSAPSTDPEMEDAGVSALARTPSMADIAPGESPLATSSPLLSQAPSAPAVAPKKRGFLSKALNYFTTLSSRAKHAGGWGNAFLGRGYNRMDAANAAASARMEGFRQERERGRLSFARRAAERDNRQSLPSIPEPEAPAPTPEERLEGLQGEHGYDPADVQRWEEQPGVDESLNPFGKFRPNAQSRPRRSVRSQWGNW